MVKTPWYEDAIPFDEAAKIGTQKVISDHSTIGVVVVSDGSIVDIPREDYLEAEKEVIPDAYNKIIELEKQNKLIIRRWNTLTEEQQKREKENIIKTFKPVMEDEFNRFPEEYELLTTLFKELKLENIQKD